MKRITCGLIMLLLLANDALTQESTPDRISWIVKVLNFRLAESAQFPLPPVIYKADLAANARYENDTIWIGQIQAEFQTDEDWMSIIYHEYWHHQNSVLFKVGRDSSGQILQWDTDQWYTYTPSEYQINRSLMQYEASLATEKLSTANRERLMAEMQKTVSQPQELPFIYAPSNLSLEEIEAYQAQLLADEAGLYHLSTAARNAILERIAQQADSYERRKAYERQEGLGPDGRRLSKP